MEPTISASSVSVDPRALAGVTASVMTAVLLLLYFYRRRAYILFWCAGWALTAVSMSVAARPFGVRQAADLAYGVSQFLGIVSGLLFVLSADAYRSRPQFRRQHGLVLLPALLWFVLAPLALGFRSVFAPGHLLIGGAMLAAGASHLWLLRTERLLGAALAGLMLVLIGTAHFYIAYNIADPTSAAAARIIFSMTAAFLLTALGMQLMTFEDMTYELRVANRELQSAQADLREMALTDPLTRCRNRRFFEEIIGKELKRHERYGIPLSFIFVDVNRFKAINDQLGHETGDRVLRQVAAFLIRNVREADFVFRWGGDEFLVLLSCRENEAQKRAAGLREAFAKSEHVLWLPEGVGLSTGCAEVPTDTEDVMEHVRIADARMYADKRATRHAAIK